MTLIKLTFFEFNKTYPKKSKCTNKPFWLNVDDISRFTDYNYNDNVSDVTQSPLSSTKITTKGGEIIEVCENVNTILETLEKLNVLEL